MTAMTSVERSRRRREAHPEYDRLWEEAHHEERLKSSRLYREVHHEQVLKSGRLYRRHNKELGLCPECGGESGGDCIRCLRCTLDNNMSSVIRVSLISRGYPKDRRVWESFVDYTLDDLLVHIQYWKDIQGLDGQPIEIHHINKRSESTWETPGDAEWKRLWSLDNLMPLTEEDHKAANRGDIDKLHPAVAIYIKGIYTIKAKSNAVFGHLLCLEGRNTPIEQAKATQEAIFRK